MISDIYWTEQKHPGRIALVGRPRGGEWLETEVAAWAKENIDIIVSMLEPAENDEFELGREAEYCFANDIEFISFPVPDRGVPKLDQNFHALVEKLRSSLASGKNIGIHCRQSVGRAPLLAAALMAVFHIEPADAFRRLSIARGREVPETAEQYEWVESFAKQRAFALT